MDDKEDLISYAKEIVRLRAAIASGELVPATAGQRVPLDWGKLVQCVLRCMDATIKNESSREQAERIATVIEERFGTVPASAVAEMRERCAQTAENFDHRDSWSADEELNNQGRYAAGETCDDIAAAIRALSPAPASDEFVVVPLTRTQFIVQMILCYGNMYPDVETKRLMQMAADTFRDFLADEKIDFGDPRYDWSDSGAQDIVHGYENVVMLNAATKDGERA
jgi:hypothetical protein